MNFKQATDALLEAITLQDLAKAMGVSVQAIRQARTSEGSAAYRTPPAGWEKATVGLINRRVRDLTALVKSLKKHENY